MRLLTCVCFCLITLLPAELSAQAIDNGPLAAGERSVRLLDSIPGAVASVKASQTSRAWEDWSATKKGAVLGLVVGAASGVALGYVLYEGYRCERTELALGAMLGGVGAAIGAGIGVLIDGDYQNPPWGGRLPVGRSVTGRSRRVSIAWRF